MPLLRFATGAKSYSCSAGEEFQAARWLVEVEFCGCWACPRTDKRPGKLVLLGDLLGKHVSPHRRNQSTTRSRLSPLLLETSMTSDWLITLVWEVCYESMNSRLDSRL